MAGANIDTVQVKSRKCDLPTAVEFLVTLATAKQKLQAGLAQDLDAAFESNLQEALGQPLAEPGVTTE